MTPLSNVPIAVDEDIDPYKRIHDDLCKLNAHLRLETSKFERTALAFCEATALPRAASKWWTMDFHEFYPLLKVKLSATEIADLAEFFDAQQQVVKRIHESIASAEYKLDELVFDLYKLELEERHTVRSAVYDASNLLF